MTASAISSTPSVHTHRHHHAGANRPTLPDAATSASGTPNSSAAPASPAAGLQKFASDLQSILLQAQSGHPAATGPAGVADPGGSAKGAPIRHVAERLQDLLGGALPPAGSSGSLQSVLDSLQKALQQNLQAYATATPATATTALTA